MALTAEQVKQAVERIVQGTDASSQYNWVQLRSAISVICKCELGDDPNDHDVFKAACSMRSDHLEKLVKDKGIMKLLGLPPKAKRGPKLPLQEPAPPDAWDHQGMGHSGHAEGEVGLQLEAELGHCQEDEVNLMQVDDAADPGEQHTAELTSDLIDFTSTILARDSEIASLRAKLAQRQREFDVVLLNDVQAPAAPLQLAAPSASAALSSSAAPSAPASQAPSPSSAAPSAPASHAEHPVNARLAALNQQATEMTASWQSAAAQFSSVRSSAGDSPSRAQLKQCSALLKIMDDIKELFTRKLSSFRGGDAHSLWMDAWEKEHTAMSIAMLEMKAKHEAVKAASCLSDEEHEITRRLAMLSMQSRCEDGAMMLDQKRKERATAALRADVAIVGQLTDHYTRRFNGVWLAGCTPTPSLPPVSEAPAAPSQRGAASASGTAARGARPSLYDAMRAHAAKLSALDASRFDAVLSDSDSPPDDF